MKRPIPPICVNADLAMVGMARATLRTALMAMPQGTVEYSLNGPNIEQASCSWPFEGGQATLLANKHISILLDLDGEGQDSISLSISDDTPLNACLEPDLRTRLRWITVAFERAGHQRKGRVLDAYSAIMRVAHLFSIRAAMIVGPGDRRISVRSPGGDQTTAHFLWAGRSGTPIADDKAQELSRIAESMSPSVFPIYTLAAKHEGNQASLVLRPMSVTMDMPQNVIELMREIAELDPSDASVGDIVAARDV